MGILVRKNNPYFDFLILFFLAVITAVTFSALTARSTIRLPWFSASLPSPSPALATCNLNSTYWGTCIPSCTYTCTPNPGFPGPTYAVETCMDSRSCGDYINYSWETDTWKCDSTSEASAYCGQGSGGGVSGAAGCTISGMPNNVYAGGQQIPFSVSLNYRDPTHTTGSLKAPNPACNGLIVGCSGGAPNDNCSGYTTSDNDNAGTCKVTGNFTWEDPNNYTCPTPYGDCSSICPAGATCSCNGDGHCKATYSCYGQTTVNCYPNATTTQIWVPTADMPNYNNGPNSDVSKLNNAAPGTDCSTLGIPDLNNTYPYQKYCSTCTPAGPVNIDSNTVKAICVKGNNTSNFTVNLWNTTTVTLIAASVNSGVGLVYRIPTGANSLQAEANVGAGYCNYPANLSLYTAAACVNSAPGPAVVLTPPNGYSGFPVMGGLLNWGGPSSWGVNCPTNNDSFPYVHLYNDNGGAPGTEITKYGPTAYSQPTCTTSCPTGSFTWSPPTLNYSTKYWWMVETNNGYTTTNGPYWSFTTAGQTYMTTYGGDVTAVGNLSDDGSLPAGSYISADGLINSSYAGIITGTSIVNTTNLSHQGTSPGWNLNSYNSLAPLSKLSYPNILATVLKYAGVTPSQLAADAGCVNGGLFSGVTKNNYQIYCYNGTNNLDTVLGSALSGAGAVGPGTYEDNNPLVRYTGSWTPAYYSDASGGTATYSNQTLATASLTVSGASNFSITTITANNRGIANILVDGVVIATFDDYSASRTPHVVKGPYSLPNTGVHTIAIQVSGKKNGSSSDYYVMLDNFIVSGPGATPGPVVVYPTSQAANQQTISTARSLTGANEKLVVFVNGNLTFSGTGAMISILTTNQTSGMVFVLNNPNPPTYSGDVTAAAGITQLDGVYLFPGTFYDNSSTTALAGNGALLGTGASPFKTIGGASTLQRAPSTGPGEIWNFEPKYLPLFDSILAPSTYTWKELPPR